jgi:hypothetical protein
MSEAHDSVGQTTNAGKAGSLGEARRTLLHRVIAAPKDSGFDTASDIAVTAVIAQSLYSEAGGKFSAVELLPDIAKWARVSVRTASAVLNRLVEHGFLLRTYPPRNGRVKVMRQGKERTPRGTKYQFVEHPAEYVRARDTVRVQKLAEYAQRKAASKGEELDLQKLLLGGTITEAEYQVRIAELRARNRRGIPARVAQRYDAQEAEKARAEATRRKTRRTGGFVPLRDAAADGLPIAAQGRR